MFWFAFLAGMACGWLWIAIAVAAALLWAKRTEPKGEPWSGGVLHDRFKK